MALRDDSEGLCGTILHHNPLPSVDSIVNKLLAKEIRLKSWVDKGILSSPNPSVFVVFPRPPSNNQSKPQAKVWYHECGFCKQKGH